ncbi:unnamed protein product [Lactuca saligna]|uniref:Uncharacterized protein n=1 Tax=Lactuca saligna TaxID=75948 RepID=A0AA35Y4E9_LACSI|nr:unnamed protein product [Lactuca saligna]
MDRQPSGVMDVTPNEKGNEKPNCLGVKVARRWKIHRGDPQRRKDVTPKWGNDPQRRKDVTPNCLGEKKRQRDVFNRLTTSLPLKEERADLKMNQPKYEEKIAKQRSAYSQERAPVRPTTDGKAVPSQRAIRNSKYILANGKYEPKPHGIKEIHTRSIEARGRVPILPPHKLSYGRKLISALMH